MEYTYKSPAYRRNSLKIHPDSYKAVGKTAIKIDKIVRTPLSVSLLDLSEILYSTRNWLIHGALLDSSFRKNPRDFQRFMSTATEITGLIIENASNKIRTAL